MHGVRKFVEVGSGRVGYAMTEAALSEVSNGAKWNPDPSFSVADAILADPQFASVLRTVLRDGYVMVPPLRRRGNSPSARFVSLSPPNKRSLCRGAPQ